MVSARLVEATQSCQLLNYGKKKNVDLHCPSLDTTDRDVIFKEKKREKQ